MLALKITDQKNFTNKLFLGDTFDLFWLNQAEIITSNVFSIDGKLQTDFFDNDEQDRCIIAEFCIFTFSRTDNRSVFESPI